MRFKQLGYIIVSLLILNSCKAPQIAFGELGQGFATNDSTYAEDAESIQLIAPYRAELDEEMEEVLATVETELNNATRRGESTLGNFVVDLLKVRSEERLGYEVDLVLINNHGGLRKPISMGPLKAKDVYELMPFDNAMWLYKLTGAQAKQVFDHTAKSKRAVLAGARFTATEDDKAIDITIDGKAFNETITYTLVISDYLANGGGGYGFVSEAGAFVEDLNYLCRDMILDHVKELGKKGETISQELDGRMKILSNE